VIRCVHVRIVGGAVHRERESRRRPVKSPRLAIATRR
jgi:hypothetical protein